MAILNSERNLKALVSRLKFSTLTRLQRSFWVAHHRELWLRWGRAVADLIVAEVTCARYLSMLRNPMSQGPSVGVNSFL